MKKLPILAAVVVSLALAATAVAATKTIPQTGQMRGDKGSKVKLKVKTKSGTPTAVKGFKALDVLTQCNGKTVRYDYFSASDFTVTGGKYDIKLTDDGAGLKIFIKGKVKSGGNKVTGSFRTNRFKDSGGRACKVAKQKFVTNAN